MKPQALNPDHESQALKLKPEPEALNRGQRQQGGVCVEVLGELPG